MTREEFENCLKKHATDIERIRQEAHELHNNVNQSYGDGLPYGYHLDMVATNVREFGHLVCTTEEDLLPLFFAAYYHDSIEDARLTYNDVMHRARMMLTEEQARLATEIVYALTNDKGRTRAERAGKKYYEGIRHTPYAPFANYATVWPTLPTVALAWTRTTTVCGRFILTKCHTSSNPSIPIAMTPGWLFRTMWLSEWQNA